MDIVATLTGNTSELPPGLQPGDIVFTRKRAIGSWLLRVLTGSFAYSHSCLVGPPKDGLPTIYTTGAKHNHLISYRYGLIDAATYLAHREYVVCRYRQPTGRLGLTKAQTQSILNYCRGHCGTPYPLHKVWCYIKQGLHGVGVSRVGGSRQKVVCCEAVAAAYANAGIHLNSRARKEPSGFTVPELYYSPELVDVCAHDSLRP